MQKYNIYFILPNFGAANAEESSLLLRWGAYKEQSPYHVAEFLDVVIEGVFIDSTALNDGAAIIDSLV